MNFLANNVTVLGLADGLDGEPAELSKTEQEEIKRMMSRRNLYQVPRAFPIFTLLFSTHFYLSFFNACPFPLRLIAADFVGSDAERVSYSSRSRRHQARYRTAGTAAAKHF